MTHDAMAQVTAQREQLVERVRLPWWFGVLFTIATVALVGTMAVMQRAMRADIRHGRARAA